MSCLSVLYFYRETSIVQPEYLWNQWDHLNTLKLTHIYCIFISSTEPAPLILYLLIIFILLYQSIVLFPLLCRSFSSSYDCEWSILGESSREAPLADKNCVSRFVTGANAQFNFISHRFRVGVRTLRVRYQLVRCKAKLIPTLASFCIVVKC